MITSRDLKSNGPFDRNLRVLLIQPPRQESVNKDYIATQIPISLCYLAAAPESLDAEVQIVDYFVEEYSPPQLHEILARFKPDIVGLGSLTASINYVEEQAQIVKSYDENILTVLGGVHFSALPEQTILEALSVDVGVIGEGEETIKELYSAWKDGNPLHSIKGNGGHKGYIPGVYREAKK